MTEPAARQSQRMTVDEFFAWDGGGHQGKVELVDGVARAMAPASSAHGMIQGSIAFLIRRHLAQQCGGCRVGVEVGVAPRIDTRHNLRVPDLTVTCAPHTPGEEAFPDPILVVEILSPSNERETWESIWACATIPSLVEILVVESESERAEVFRKDGKGEWPQDPEVTSSGGVIRLASIGAELPLPEVYAGTRLE